MRILVTSALGCGEQQLDEIRALGHDVQLVADERAPLPPDAFEAEGVVCNALFLHNDVKRFPNLAFVQLTSAGQDRAPEEYLRARGIPLFSARGVYSAPLAEWVVLQVLQIYKRSRFFWRNQDEHQWLKARDLRELTGRTVCIVGFGDVGRAVAKRMRAFDVRIVAVDSTPTPSPLADTVFPAAALGDALRSCDIVILTLPLTPKTRHIIDDAAIGSMKLDSVLVDVSRGQVVDEGALIRALHRGHFSGVALDVFEDEPLSEDSELWDFERVHVTPHNSFVSDKTRERLFDLVLDTIRRVGSGH